jgi:hypothetical protein
LPKNVRADSGCIIVPNQDLLKQLIWKFIVEADICPWEAAPAAGFP